MPPTPTPEKPTILLLQGSFQNPLFYASLYTSLHSLYTQLHTSSSPASPQIPPPQTPHNPHRRCTRRRRRTHTPY
ncbi:hypothetical protein K505DRAFT_324411 [Melanomma pulvis-pyrius CBS 109.77]|uniref:Uncharacterized protein n=1 Tax=Melanomma pulvis-pyrius CBS 109.77 TaxID=1314802 RepID=A0A6A6XFZ8_9PLEO|nr:hypothetical protein K505DRAFT_324411 [Melanomma pulvis-pyrius CBS 109.77]